MEVSEQVIDISEDKWIFEPPEDSKVFHIKAWFGDGYKWSKLLKSINKYGALLFEAYWYDVPHSGNGSRSIRRGEYKIVTDKPTRFKRSLTWLQKLEDMELEITEDDWKNS
jgi:hypothetical protein